MSADITGALAGSGGVFLVLALIAAIINSGTPRYDRSEILSAVAWIFLAISAVCWLLAIWGPVIS